MCPPTAVRRQDVCSDWVAVIAWTVCLACFLEGDEGFGKSISLGFAVRPSNSKTLVEALEQLVVGMGSAR